MVDGGGGATVVAMDVDGGAVVEVALLSEAFLARTGMVVFHWWVEKGLVTLAGSVMSWSPAVDRRDSGTVGRSQAGRLLSGSSAGQTQEEQM